MTAYTLIAVCIGATFGWFLFQKEVLLREKRTVRIGAHEIGYCMGYCKGYDEGYKECYDEEVPVRLSNGRFSKPGRKKQDFPSGEVGGIQGGG